MKNRNKDSLVIGNFTKMCDEAVGNAYNVFDMSQDATSEISGHYALVNALQMWIASEPNDYIMEPDQGGKLIMLVGNGKYALDEKNESEIAGIITDAIENNWSDLTVGDCKVKAQPEKRRWYITLTLINKVTHLQSQMSQFLNA